MTTRRTAVLDAPSNLGLRPPEKWTVPGCYKLAGALRDCGLVSRIGAEDAGYVVPPRYARGNWKPGDGVFNAPGIATYSKKLADRLEVLFDDGRFPVVLGGECSILLGPALALKRRGRYGVAYLDGHSDFRHLGNSDHVGAAGGEALALVTGRGQPDLTDLEGLGPYVQDADVVSIGIRDDDWGPELRDLGIPVWEASRIRAEGADTAADAVLAHLRRDELDGFWVHVDVDILDPSVMPAVDSPDPGGLDGDEFVTLLTTLVASPACVGIHIGIFDPDLDPDGHLATTLTNMLVPALTPTP